MSYNPKVVSFERSSAYMHHRAMVNRRENNAVDALELMRHAVESAPHNREYRLDLAELYCEMGCHEQSNRLLLDMLAQKDAPAECYYGLALNQLGMNDIDGARHSLWMYRHADPEGEHAQDVSRLAEELNIYEAMNRPISRRLYRAMRVAERACDAMREGNLQAAVRMFEHSLSMSSEQYEMRALYAMALMMSGDNEAALREAQKAIEGYPPSLRATCVAAQVFFGAGKRAKGSELLRRAMEDHPDGVEMRLLIFALCELDMAKEAAECARLALQETPYDRQLLHIRAVALYRAGVSDERLGKLWLRICRIDPEDSIAGFFQEACARGELAQNEPDYIYQVPAAEFERRFTKLSEQIGEGLPSVRSLWKDDYEFRKMIRWAAGTDDERLRRVAVTVFAAMDDEEARSDLRTLLFSREVQPELKIHAASLLKLRGADIAAVMPAVTSAADMVLPEPEELVESLPVGERQMLRYAVEVLEDEYNLSALPELSLMWAYYRRHRGMRTDPLINTEAVSAALAYLHMMRSGQRVPIAEISKRFGCTERRMVFYASRIAGVLDRLEGDTKDENL